MRRFVPLHVRNSSDGVSEFVWRSVLRRDAWLGRKSEESQQRRAGNMRAGSSAKAAPASLAKAAVTKNCS